jgi:hypothetical protein
MASSLFTGGLMNLLRRLSVIALVGFLASCQNPAGPTQLSGSYHLESVNGRGPATGVILFLPGGSVMRSVRYAQGDGSLSNAYVASGSYSVTGVSNIELDLRDSGGKSSYVWKVSGLLADGLISLGYPDPADGWITESYRRD